VDKNQANPAQVRIGSRRKARSVALQALFEVDCVDHAPEGVLKWLTEETALSEEAESFARELVLKVLENRGNIDAAIQRLAPTWPVEQIASIERNILRLGICEIILAKVPAKVAINEAIELAKSFGTDSSSRFVNGVLGSFYAQFLDNKDSTDSTMEGR